MTHLQFIYTRFASLNYPFPLSDDAAYTYTTRPASCYNPQRTFNSKYFELPYDIGMFLSFPVYKYELDVAVNNRSYYGDACTDFYNLSTYASFNRSVHRYKQVYRILSTYPHPLSFYLPITRPAIFI